LAGPIIRQASGERIYVWFATSIPLKTAKLLTYKFSYLSKTPSRNRTPLRANYGHFSVKAGESLFINIVGAEPRPKSSGEDKQVKNGGIRIENREEVRTRKSGSFPTGEFLAYDIEWEPKAGGGSKRLKDLIDLKKIIYPPFDLPTLILQDKSSSRLNCLYASCRKMHGYGLDASEAGEKTLARFAADRRRRPHALSLGGDQIYADDIADVLIRPIQALAKQIFGKIESVPGYKNPAKLPIRGRMSVVKKDAKFTSGEAENHLLSFSEYAATYLMAWNPELWPKLLANWSDVWVDSNPRIPVRKAKEEILDQQKRVLQAKYAGDHARRMLANVPTYMIFDDHEVTDDWYLSNSWKKKVQGTKLGRRVLANGLAAFYLFQAWGNDVPGMTNIDLLKAISAYAHNQETGGKDLENKLLGFHDWSFLTPTRPSIINTNIRTRREQTSNRIHWRFKRLPVPSLNAEILSRDAPRLMNFQERRRLDGLIGKARRADSRIVVVTPTPVYGLESMEALQDNATSVMGTGKGAKGSTLDNEGFHADPNSFIDIVQKVCYSDPRFVIFLSGDVHYGFTVVARARLTRRSIKIAQFTSSATKNEPHGFLETGLWLLKTKPSIIRLFDQKRKWWRPYAKADSTLRIGDMGWLDAAADAAELTVKLVKGDPNFEDESEFIPRNTGSLSRLLYDDLVEMQNNMGHLELIGSEVINKLIKVKRPGQPPVESLKTQWTAWPIK
jgi:hypothetical protein